MKLGKWENFKAFRSLLWQEEEKRISNATVSNKSKFVNIRSRITYSTC
jgi:hypothetical protein